MDLEIDMKSIKYFKLGAKFCRHQYKMKVYVYLCKNPSTSILFPLTMLFRDWL